MLRLSELLDRFRPAGSPGASTAAGGAIVGVPPSELDAILRELRGYETEAAALIATADAEASRLRAAAHEHARQIQAGVPEACAAAEADASAGQRHALESSISEVSADSDREIERLRTSVAERIAPIVAEAVLGVRTSAQPAHVTSVGQPSA